MRLFRVTEEWKANHEQVDNYALITQAEDGPGIYLPSYFLPARGALAAPFEHSRAPQRLAVASLVEEEGTYALRPASRETVIRAGRSINSEYGSRYFGECLVHLCLPPSPYKHTLHASSFGERLLPFGRTGSMEVVREYLGIGDAEGVEFLADEKNGREALIRMQPKASFRVHRPAEIAKEGESPVLTISWTGSFLRVYRPDYFRQGKPRKAWGERDARPVEHPALEPAPVVRLGDLVARSSGR